MSIRFFNTDFIAVDGETIIENNGYLKIKDKETAEIGQVFGKKADGSFGFVDVSNADMIDGKHAITEPLTEEKNDIISMINEVFGYANDGKTVIAQAIANKGVEAENTETFLSLAGKIGEIEDGQLTIKFDGRNYGYKIYNNYGIDTNEIVKVDNNTFSNLNNVRANAGIAANNDYIIIAGGHSTITTLDIYDKDLTLLSNKQLNISRPNCESTTVGNYTIIAGSNNSIECFDNNLVKLDNPSPLQSNRKTAGKAISIGKYALIIGGDANGSSNEIDVYDDQLVKSIMTPLSSSIQYFNATTTSSGEHIIIAGGSNSSTVNIYNKELVKQTNLSLVQGRSFLGATSIENYAMFAGGNNTSSGAKYNNVDIFNNQLIRTNTTISNTRAATAGASLKNNALFAGGISGTPASKYHDIVDVFDSELIRTLGIPINIARSYIKSISSNNQAFFIGGEPATNNIEIYRFNNLTCISINKGNSYKFRDNAEEVIAETDFLLKKINPVNGYVKIPNRLYKDKDKIEVDLTSNDDEIMGKILISDAINNKGVLSNYDDSFVDLSEQINDIKQEIIVDGNSCGYRIFDNYFEDNSFQKINTDLKLRTSSTNILCETIDGYMIAAGGGGIQQNESAALTANVDAFDSNLVRLAISDLLEAKIIGASISYNNKAIFMGGRGNTYFNTVEAYDKNLVKTLLPNISAAGYLGTAAKVGNYFAAISFYNGKLNNYIDIYNDELVKVNHSLNTIAATEFRSFTLNENAVFGGAWTSNAINDVFSINPDLLLNVLSPLSTARSSPAANANSNYGIFAGGYITPNIQVDDVDVYSKDLVKISSNIAKVDFKSFRIKSIEMNEKIVIPCGDFSASDLVTVYDKDLVKLESPKLSQSGSGFSIGKINNRVLIIGGLKSNYLNTINVFHYGTSIEIKKSDIYKLNSLSEIIADRNINLIFNESVNGYIKTPNKIYKGDIEETLQISEDSLTGKILITELLKQNGIDASIEESFASLTTKIKNLL